jgi:Ni2+-binding GTPase involved in maturation of urease and hydrogenase
MHAVQPPAGTQGCGKTTLVELLEALFAHNGIRAAAVSIDDFYLTFADQQALAQVRLSRPLPLCTPASCKRATGLALPASQRALPQHRRTASTVCSQ